MPGPSSFLITAALLSSVAPTVERVLDAGIPANSEQRQPPELFSRAAERAGLAPDPADESLAEDGAEETLSRLAQLQGARLFKRRPPGHVELWLTRNDEGRLTWTFARWRADPARPWSWLEESQFSESARQPENLTWPSLPLLRDTRVRDQAEAVFRDFLELRDLYGKPLFGDCVWTDVTGRNLVTAWQHPDLRDALKETLTGSLCYALPMPSRVDGVAVSWTAKWNGNRLILSEKTLKTLRDVEHAERTGPAPSPDPAEKPLSSTAEDQMTYFQDIRILSGELEARFPLSNQVTRFERKNSADSANQLLELARYLEERYALLGIQTRWQRFEWRGIPQANLIAEIPGSDPSAPPVILADHFDTAFAEDAFDATGSRLSAPGADDNMTATAALLGAARLLRNAGNRHPIWLLHLTGEEFPGDDLGARHAISAWLKEGQKVQAILLMDMIGYRKPGDRIFQVNAGQGTGARHAAARALFLARQEAPGLQARFRSRFDARSYLYNTDGLIFSDWGYPVVLFNEHINAHENLNRPHYHQTTDLSRTLDAGYAWSIARTAIATARSLAR